MKQKENKKRLEKLEAVRGFAAFYVVLFHIFPRDIIVLGVNVGTLFRFGPEAVIVFFVLSGFVINYTFTKSRDKSFRYYFVRRFVRLYIPLLFIFLLGYGIECYKQGMLADPDWPNLIGNLFMVQDVISLKPNVLSAAYMGNTVLWSLSYEWWFYMLFFFLAKHIERSKLDKWVFAITIAAALTYLVYPFTVNRLVMYFAIWWIGAKMADVYMNNESYTFRTILPVFYVLLGITGILTINFALNYSYTAVYNYPLVAYPFVEVRHFVFAIMVMFAALIWNRIKWVGFNWLFGIFKYLAPCSYVIYISHHYLVVEASYLSFLQNKIIEYALYILVMIGFSYGLEVVVYNRIRRRLIR